MTLPLSESHRHREILDKEIKNQQEILKNEKQRTKYYKNKFLEADSFANKLRKEVDNSKIEHIENRDKAAAAAEKITNLTQELNSARLEKERKENTIKELKKQVYDHLTDKYFGRAARVEKSTMTDSDTPIVIESSDAEEDSEYHSSKEDTNHRLTITQHQRNVRIGRIRVAIERFYNDLGQAHPSGWNDVVSKKIENNIYLDAEKNPSYFIRINAAVRRIRANDSKFVYDHFYS